MMTDITPYLPGFVAAYAILLVAAFSPGPSVALLVGIATGQGRGAALIATLGIAMGSVTINILTILGVGLILSEAAWAISLLRLLGGAYLLYLAYGAFSRATRPSSLQQVAIERLTPTRNFLTGYLLQVSNPKAIAFWLAIASIGAVEGAGVEIVIAFVAGAFVISFFCHGAWAVALSAGPIRAAYLAGRRWVESLLGCFFCFAAWKLATAET